MKKNAKLAPSPTSLRQVAVFLHNADFLRLRVTKLPPDSPTERCCFALGTGNDLERRSQKTRDIPREFMRLAKIPCIAKRVTENGVNSNALFVYNCEL